MNDPEAVVFSEYIEVKPVKFAQRLRITKTRRDERRVFLVCQRWIERWGRHRKLVVSSVQVTRDWDVMSMEHYVRLMWYAVSKEEWGRITRTMLDYHKYRPIRLPVMKGEKVTV